MKAGATMIVLRIKASVNAQFIVVRGSTNHFDLTLLRRTIFVLHQTTSYVIMSIVFFFYVKPDRIQSDVLYATQLI